MRTPYSTILASPLTIRSGWQHPWVEATIWCVGLLLVAAADPAAPSIIDLCVFKAVGLPGCPGCGLGHAMGYLFRGEWALALESHGFSPFVLGVLALRVTGLVRLGFARS